MREISDRAIEAYGEPIKNVSAFKCLGIVLTAGDGDWLAVVGNLGKARRSWGRLSQVMGQEEAYPKVSRAFYTSVAQAVILFGVEMWVLTLRMEKALDSYQYRVASSITGRQPRQKKDGSWDYPPLEGALREAGMVGIHTYITQRQNTFAQYIATRPILYLCKKATWMPGDQVYRWWWEQAGIDLEGASKRAAESTTR